MTVLPLLLLAAGGVYIATKVLDKKAAPASTPKQSFEAVLAELKNDAAIQKGIAELVADIGKPVKDSSGNVVNDITKRMREIWDSNKAADLHGAAEETGAAALYPVPDRDADVTKARGWMLRLGGAMQARALELDPKLVSPTLFTTQAAIENAKWLPAAQVLAATLAKVISASKGAAGTDKEEIQGFYLELIHTWLSTDPQEHVTSALSIKPMLADKTLPENVAAAARTIVDVETVRAQRLGAPAAALAAIASTAMGV